MEGGVGQKGNLTNPRPWRGRCQAGCPNTGGPPLPRKRVPLQKRNKNGQIFVPLPNVLGLAKFKKSNSWQRKWPNSNTV